MHIEKINDNQIKCILSQRDLLSRELDLSELAYGTEKARSLFREMIEQAHHDFGFEAENTPLMVEAIPVSRDSIILIITRMDNPDELDTRFSRFSSMAGDDIAMEEDNDFSDGADDILDLFRSIADKTQDNFTADGSEELLFRSDDTAPLCDPDHSESAEAESDRPINLMRIYSFDNLDDLLTISGILHSIYNGVNSLYKDPVSSRYYLVIYQSQHTPADFNKVCNLISEYGQREKGTCAREAYYAEHYSCIVSQTALQRLYLF
ncbi:MAG: adaptor protein MecA [Lachnospiraceae bacterium]|nr:adaptor protein MecA [Lachnospiraceae bacterium]MDY4971702.1 adaptor protein MecA [Lachnospiraceae bacterium]